MSLQTLKRRLGQPTNSGTFGFSGSYADPIRNIDWILIAVVALQSIIGLFNVFSTTHLRLLDQEFDPYLYTTPGWLHNCCCCGRRDRDGSWS